MLEGNLEGNKDKSTVGNDNDKKIELSVLAPFSSSLSPPHPSGASSVSNVAAVSKLIPSESLVQASGVPPSAAKDDDVKGIISAAFSKEVISQLKQIQDLMSVFSKAYFLFAENFNKIAECLEELGDNELTDRGKKDIQIFLSRKFLEGLYGYILNFDDDYRYRNSYKFEKILKRLDLLVNDKSSLCQKQAKYIIYQLENILKLFEFVKKQSVPGQNYNYDMLAHFDEIEAVLKIIKADELELKYKKIIKNLKESILLEAASYRKFTFNMYGTVLKSIDELVVSHEKKNISKKNWKKKEEVEGQSSFGGILNSLSMNKKSKEKEVLHGPVSNIIFSLGCIKEIIQQPEFNKKSTGEKIDDDNLKAQFYIIKDLLMMLKASELNLVNKNCIIKILLDIRLILDQNKFDKFYSKGGEMAEIFFNLECQCSAQDNDIKDNKIKKSRNRESQQRFPYSAEQSHETSGSSELEDSKKSDSRSSENSTIISLSGNGNS